MTGVDRPYRGVSAEDRREERRVRLLDACLDVVGESGVVTVTAELVAQRAGLSKRYFYESFAGRDEILVAALAGFFESLQRAIVEALADAEPAARSRRTVEALLDELAADPRVARLYAEAVAHPSLAARLDRGIGDYVDLLLDVVLRVRRSPRSRVMVTMVVAGTTDVVIRWLTGDLRVSRRALVDHLVEAGAALTAELPRRTGGTGRGRSG